MPDSKAIHEVSISRNPRRETLEVAIGTKLRKQRVYLSKEDAAYIAERLLRWAQDQETTRYHYIRKGQHPPPHS